MVADRDGWRLAHGGDIGDLPADTADPVDLSTGINPFSYPLGEIDGSAYRCLPQGRAEARVTSAARAAYGVPDGVDLVAAPGSQAILQWLPHLSWPEGPVAVVAPTYGEHGHLWRAAGRTVREVAHPADAGDAVITVVGQPNNPDGRTWPPSDLMAVHRRLASRGGLLIVDEAFADLDPACSLIPHGGGDGPLVLRSFGKFFGLAGLRLGFAIGAADPVAALARRLGPWAVAGPALAIGAEALADASWQESMRARLAAEAGRRDAALRGAGASLLGGTVLFRLIGVPNAAHAYGALRSEGILVRRFPDRPHWLRVGLAADGEDVYARLAAVLSRMIRSGGG